MQQGFVGRVLWSCAMCRLSSSSSCIPALLLDLAGPAPMSTSLPSQSHVWVPATWLTYEARPPCPPLTITTGLASPLLLLPPRLARLPPLPPPSPSLRRRLWHPLRSPLPLPLPQSQLRPLRRHLQQTPPPPRLSSLQVLPPQFPWPACWRRCWRCWREQCCCKAACVRCKPAGATPDVTMLSIPLAGRPARRSLFWFVPPQSLLHFQLAHSTRQSASAL